MLILLFDFVSENYFSKEKDHVTPGPEGSDGEGIKIAGGSVIIDPMGKILAGPLRGKEGYAGFYHDVTAVYAKLIFPFNRVLTAELDLDTIIRGKFDLDVSGHYARKDIFELVVKK